jgi:integrase
LAATKTRPTKRRANGAGHLRQLPSGRWQARFPGPDGATHNAPETFDTKLDADAWLKGQARAAERGYWSPPAKAAAAGSVRDHAERYVSRPSLRPKTSSQYRKLLDDLILPVLGDVPLDELKPATVRNWWNSLDHAKPSWTSQGYQLLRAVCRVAVDDEVIAASPCRVKGAGRAKSARKPRPATLAELDAIVEAIPERYKAMILLAAWCAMRQGELFDLRRRDIDVEKWRVTVDSGVSHVDGVTYVGPPKTEAGRRVIGIPGNVHDALTRHLEAHTGPEEDALLFPARGGGHMVCGSLYKVYYPAREKAGRPDLRFHDLRHTGATLAAQAGATIADLQARLGHTTPAAAMVYQHTAEERDDLITARLANMATRQE